jgi:hypothetical protein
MQRKVDWVDAQRCRARRTAHGWVESWSRGQKSQRASSACSGGVSAVMGTSDFDAHTFAQHSSFAIGVKAHCPLKQNLRQWKRRAWQPQYRPNDHCLETSTAPNGPERPKTLFPSANRTESCKHSIDRYYLRRIFTANDALKIITKECQDMVKRSYHWSSITIQINRNVKP